MSGPLPGLAADVLARKSLYLVPDRRLLMDTETSKLGPMDPRRLLSLGQHVLPLLNVGGNVDQSMGKSAPAGMRYSIGNAAMRLSGSPAIRAVNEGAAREAASRANR